MYIDLLGNDYMKAFNNWIKGGANSRVGTLKQKDTMSREIHRVGFEFILQFQNELSRLEVKGYDVECFSPILMDQIYIEIRNYWRNEAAFSALGMSLSQILKYIDKLVDDFLITSKRGGTETVQRWMSKAELKATQETGLLRGGREGTHYVTGAVNSDALRARQRLALPQTPEVEVSLEVPKDKFSPPSKVDPAFNMPGGGMERTATGDIPVKIIKVQ